MAERTPKNQGKGSSPKNKKSAMPRGGAGPRVSDRKESVQKGVSPGRRARGDDPR